MGYSKVAHYPEGKQGWMEAGFPVEKAGYELRNRALVRLHAEVPRGAANPTAVTTRPSKVLGDMVDLVGIEPTTSSMPWKRAPSCATGPQRIPGTNGGQLILA